MAKGSKSKTTRHSEETSRPTKRKRIEEEEEDDEDGFFHHDDEGGLMAQEDDDSEEESDDMDGEAPRAIAWQDDEDLDRDSSSAATSEDEDDEGDEDTVKMRKLQREMASLPFGTLLQAKKETNLSDESSSESESSDEEEAEAEEEAEPAPLDWKPAAERKKVPKRVTKTAPLVETSKKPVSRFRQIVEVKKMDARDPRFSSLSGEFNPTKFAAEYSFIGDIQREEAKTLRHTIRDKRKSLESLTPSRFKEREERRLEDLKRALNRTEGSIKQARRESKEREVLAKAKKEEREKRGAGKGEWYFKEADKRKLLLEAKFADITQQGGQRQIKKVLEKKQKKIAQQEKRSRPYAKGEFYGGEDDGGGERPAVRQDNGRKGRHTMREGRSMTMTRDNGWPSRDGPPRPKRPKF